MKHNAIVGRTDLYWYRSLDQLKLSLARRAKEAVLKILLVPLDGSALAEQVLPFVRQWAPLLTTRVHLLMVITDAQKQYLIAHFTAAPAEATGSYETDQHKQRRAQAQLARAAAAYLDEQAQALRAAGLDVTFEVAGGTPAERIAAIAAQEPQALIAMATHGSSGLRRWRLGSVADTLVHATRKPLLLVHARAEPPADTPPLRRILVPLDGSALAEQALPLAIALAIPAQAELLLFQAVRPHIVSAPELLHRPPPTIDFPPPAHAQALHYLQGVAERWHPRGLAALPIVASGEPGQAIIDTAANEQADLIVMATQGASGVWRWMLGGVADKVLHASNVPLLLVRAHTQELEA